MKPRSDSRLFKLSADQQARLYEWIHKLGYAKAKELAAQPPPDGFGIRTHLNSLCLSSPAIPKCKRNVSSSIFSAVPQANFIPRPSGPLKPWLTKWPLISPPDRSKTSKS